MLLRFNSASFFRALLVLFLGGFGLLSAAFGDAAYVSWSQVTTAGYGNGIDTCSFRNNAIYTVGNYQFVAYYNNDNNGLTPHVTIARRDKSTNTWNSYTTTYTAFAVTDDHDVISFGIDGNGYMHMSWGMHGNVLNYAKSTASVLNTGSISFNTSTIPNVGTATTYPEFYNLSDGDLLFVYRTGASGSGNSLYTRYNTDDDTWAASPTTLINGLTGSYYYGGWSNERCAYSNNWVFDSQGRVQMSWVWRETADFQSNHDIMYAYATSENLSTWLTKVGSSQTVPITLNNSTTANGGIIKSLNTGMSLINQTSMTVDANNNPIIATYWAPDGNTRQYMLEYYDGSSWQTSQISNRTVSDSKITDNDATKIRQMGRPIVVVDPDGRTIVITRSNDQNNVVTAYYSTNKTTWNYVNLTTADSGRYEPIYDEVRWKNENILDLFYEPAFANADGSRSSGAQPVSVLEWDALHWLRSNITVDWAGGNTAGATNWGVTANWTNAALPPDGKWTCVRFGNQSSGNSVVNMLTAGRTVGNLIFTATTSTTIQSTSGYALTLDNSGADSTISLAGTHTIAAQVLLNNDVDISGSGTLTLSGGVSGSYGMNILSGNVNASCIQLTHLYIGSGAKLSISPTTGEALGTDFSPVPEPSIWLLLTVGALCPWAMAGGENS